MNVCLYSSDDIKLSNYKKLDFIDVFLHVNLKLVDCEKIIYFFKQEKIESIENKKDYFLIINEKKQKIYFLLNKIDEFLETINYIFIGNVDINNNILKFLKLPLNFIASCDYDYENNWNTLTRKGILFGLHNDQIICNYFSKFILLEDQKNFTSIFRFFNHLEKQQKEYNLLS